MNIRSLVKQALTGQQNKRYERIYLEKRVTYDQWILQEEKSSSADRRDWREADKEPLFFYVFTGSQGELAENALEEIAGFFIEHKEVSLLYADEDVREGGKQGIRSAPWFKPDWSPDTFLSFYYFGNMTALRGNLAGQAGILEDMDFGLKDALGMQKDKYPDNADQVVLEKMPWVTVIISDYPDWQQWKPISRKLAALSGGFLRSSAGIGHIPKILFHASSIQAQEKYFSWNDPSFKGKHQKETGSDNIQVSVIIPSKDNPEILEQAVRSLMDTAGEISYEVIVVDNGSLEENKKKTEKWIQTIADQVNITYLYDPMEFNFSKMCNLGAEKAKGKHLLFLNDDVEMKGTGWMGKMMGKSSCPYTGAVGLKLYYPESHKIQHAGITNLPMGPVHKLQFHTDKESYYYGRNRFDSNVLAVTGACLMVQKEKFQRVNGFPEELSVAFNDVDLCFSLYELGYQNVVINTFAAWHHESLSRGGDDSREKLERLLGERDKLYENHPGLRGEDPYYPRGLNRDGLDTSIRPGFLTSGNVIQPAAMKEMDVSVITSFRQDQCLMVRIEYCGQDKIYGYGVVLGDNNACYKKSLLLGMDDRAAGEEDQWVPKKIWSQELWEQYRPDLEENMKDQSNVALSGFSLDLTQLSLSDGNKPLDGKKLPEEKERSGGNGLPEENKLPKGKHHPEGNMLPPGNYRIGFMAVSRIGGTKLMNWSNRFLHMGQSGGTTERKEGK